MSRLRRPALAASPLCALAALGLALFLAVPSQAARAQAARPALYDFLRAHIDPATGRLKPRDPTLPDERDAERHGDLRSVPGALEGLSTRHMQWDPSEKTYRIVQMLELISEGDTMAKAVLYELLRADDVVTYYDDALDLAAARIPSAEPQLHDLARRLATSAPDRGPVKFGIALLGSIADERDLGIVQTLALHDEFGLYAAQAVAAMSPDPQHALFDMARKVSGWGRIEAVTQMVATQDPALRHWLLTEGFRNDINPQYLALQCAEIADLAGALGEIPKDSGDDRLLLIGAADLIRALIEPGPGRGFDDYPDAASAATLFLEHVRERRDSVSFFLAAHALRDYVTARERDGRSTDATWDAASLKRVAALADEIIADRSWRRHVVAALLDDRGDMDSAELAARKLGIDTFRLHVQQLARNGTNAERWSHAFASADSTRIDRLVSVAERTFGPRFANDRARDAASGDGPQKPDDASASAALAAVLHGFARYPGSGLELVESSLGDENHDVRRAAVDTLVRWGSAYLSGFAVRAALNDALRSEPDEVLRARMAALLDVGKSSR